MAKRRTEIIPRDFQRIQEFERPEEKRIQNRIKNRHCNPPVFFESSIRGRSILVGTFNVPNNSKISTNVKWPQRSPKSCATTIQSQFPRKFYLPVAICPLENFRRVERFNKIRGGGVQNSYPPSCYSKPPFFFGSCRLVDVQESRLFPAKNEHHRWFLPRRAKNPSGVLFPAPSPTRHEGAEFLARLAFSRTLSVSPANLFGDEENASSLSRPLPTNIERNVVSSDERERDRGQKLDTLRDRAEYGLTGRRGVRRGAPVGFFLTRDATKGRNNPVDRRRPRDLVPFLFIVIIITPYGILFGDSYNLWWSTNEPRSMENISTRTNFTRDFADWFATPSCTLESPIQNDGLWVVYVEIINTTLVPM